MGEARLYYTAQTREARVGLERTDGWIARRRRGVEMVVLLCRFMGTLCIFSLVGCEAVSVLVVYVIVGWCES